MTLIAITGKIASGKSTAVKLLSHSWKIFQHKNINYIDLDLYCKNLLKKDKSFAEELSKFFKDNFNNPDIPNSGFIIYNVFSDDNLYHQYCNIYAPYIYAHLKSLLSNNDTINVIEASALYSYDMIFAEGKISNLFDNIIVVNPNESIIKRNSSSRCLNRQTFDIVSSRQLISQNKKNIFVNLNVGTLQELRSKIEEAFIISIKNSFPNNVYLEDACDCLSYLNVHFSEKTSWNSNPYHNLDHTRGVLTDLILSGKFTKVLGLSAIYHDVLYDPRNSDNEKIASEFTYKHMLDNKFLGKDQETGKPIKIEKALTEVVSNIVLNSGFKDLENNPLSKILFLSDISGFCNTLEEIIEQDNLIFKEYSFFDWQIYKERRLEILNELKTIKFLPEEYINGLNIAISYFKTFTPRIGYFCGSFNPFTIGHYDILKKAEQQFDKVVLIQAQNPDKNTQSFILSDNKTLAKSYQIVCNVKSIPHLLNNNSYKPTLIRGIRNNQDVEDSKIWLQQIKEFIDFDVNLILILGDPNYNHISSSFVRNILNMNKSIERFTI